MNETNLRYFLIKFFALFCSGKTSFRNISRFSENFRLGFLVMMKLVFLKEELVFSEVRVAITCCNIDWQNCFLCRSVQLKWECMSKFFV